MTCQEKGCALKRWNRLAGLGEIDFGRFQNVFASLTANIGPRTAEEIRTGLLESLSVVREQSAGLIQGRLGQDRAVFARRLQPAYFGHRQFPRVDPTEHKWGGLEGSANSASAITRR